MIRCGNSFHYKAEKNLNAVREMQMKNESLFPTGDIKVALLEKEAPDGSGRAGDLMQ